MTKIFTELDLRDIDNYRFVQLKAPFIFESDKLKEAGLSSLVEVPAGFVYDMESVPIVRGSNNRGGTAHDYLCRIDSVPVVTKALAASVYLEIMSYCYEIVDRGYWQHFKDFTKRWTKWFVVYTVPAAFYYHKFKVMATSEEIVGVNGDPFVTAEEVGKLIEKSDQVTEGLKDVKAEKEGTGVPVSIKQTETIAAKSAEVTEGTQEVKDEKKITTAP